MFSWVEGTALASDACIDGKLGGKRGGDVWVEREMVAVFDDHDGKGIACEVLR